MKMIPSHATKRPALLWIAVALIPSGVLLGPISAQAQGAVPLWTNRYDGGFADYPSAMAVDSSGNVFLTGESWNSNSSDGADFVTIKYSNTGVPLWTNRYSSGPGGSEDSAWAIAVDRTGNAIVTGSSATIKYSSAGVPLWTNRLEGGGISVATDTNGNVFVAAFSAFATIAYSHAGQPLWTNRYGTGAGSHTAAVDNTGNVIAAGPSDSAGYTTVKYSNAGVPLWTNHYSGGEARAMALDGSGNAFVTGSAASDYATVAYSHSGVPLWTNRYDGPANQGDGAFAIAVDKRGNVFVTGSSVRDLISGSPDYATIKYSNKGIPLWTNRYDAGFSDSGTAIAVDSSGNVFVTGLSRNSGCCPAKSEYATIAYSNAGELLWQNRYSGPGNLVSWPHAIAVDSTGNVFVAGRSQNSNGISDYATIKYSSSIPPPRLDSRRLNNQLVLTWTNAGFNLQSAPVVTGPFTNLPVATSPYTNPLAAPQQFFRLKLN